jgi:integrase/recombinase XerD
MKAYFPRYGSRSKEIEHTLTQADKVLLDSFLRHCAMTAGKGQVDKHRRNLWYLRDVVEKPLDSITREDAVTFWGLLKRAPYEEHTKISVQKTVKRFLKWHYRDYELLELLKIRKNYLVNKKRINKSVLIKQHEYELMVRRAESVRDKALLVLIYETAARPEEVQKLRWGHVNWAESEVHLYSRKKEDDRDLPVKDALTHLRRWYDEWVFLDPKDDDFVFPSRKGGSPQRGKPLSVEYINRVVKRTAKLAGVTREVNTYLFRHTRLTEIRKKGVVGKMHNRFAGHADGSKQELVYDHMDNDDMKREIVDKIYEADALGRQPSSQYDQDKRLVLLEEQLKRLLVTVKKSTEVAGLGDRA